MTHAAIDPTGFISTELVRDVAVITFNRPDKLNALSGPMRVELASLIRSYGTGAEVRGIVLTGTGRGFSAGEDLESTRADAADNMISAVETFHDITRAILTTSVPVVAAVNGIAVGGASEVTMCCDRRIGSSQAEYFMPENSIGLTISNASSILLRRLVGNHATRVVMESPRIKAEEALAIGLLDQIVTADRLVEESIDLVWRWTPEGGATSAHLSLLRPLLADIEAAIERENVAAKQVWDSGLVGAGIDRFWAAQAQR